MSLILDALHRSEKDRRDSEHVADIHSPVSEEALSKPRRLPLRYIVEALLLLLVVGYLLWPADKVALVAQEPVVAPLSEEVPVVELSPKLAAPEIRKMLEPIESVEPAPQQAPVEVAAVAAIDDLYSKKAAIKEQPVKTVDAQQDVVKERSEEQSQAASRQQLFNELPAISELPSSLSRRIKSIDYAVHVYSVAEDSGVVTLNGQQLRVGGRVDNGLLIVDILEAGLVLDFQGTLFKMPALNSWVNY
jgi:hypothetical protein